MLITGRYNEIEEFSELLTSNKSELVAVLGRRRVGKTYLIKNFFNKHMLFEFTGIFNGTLTEHMDRFAKQMGNFFYGGQAIEQPKNWYKAFDQLELAIKSSRSKKKKVIFLDELPWMGSSHISFKNAFSLFWNAFVSTRNDIIIIFSGSSTAWLHNKVFKDRGGLFQRVTKRIHLAPFNLYETAQFLKNKGIQLNKYAILDLYMIFGGIPFYLELIKQGESVTQAVDRLFFRRGAELQTEFEELFKSLFDNKLIYKNIVTALAKHPEGLYRNDLIKKLKLSSGGQLSNILEELEHCGFITIIYVFGNKRKDKKYKLTDAYTLFYLKFVNNNQPKPKFVQLVRTQQWVSWSGLAFENTCKAHVPQIKQALKIDGILSVEGSWFHKGSAQMHGAQIDLLIDRSDKVINLCEIKYYNNKVTLTKEMAAAIRAKIASFMYYTETRKTLMPIIIAPYGMAVNNHSMGFIQNVIDANHLFTQA